MITFATYAFLEDAYKPVLEEFQKLYPNITVQVREIPPAGDTRQIASAADTALLMFRPLNGGRHFLDVTPFEEVDPSFQTGSFWPGILEACQDAEGRAYGLPVSAEPAGIFYQEKAFTDARLPLPRPGWTWEDFKKAIPALARSESGLPVYGFADDGFMDTPDETLLSPRISFLLDQSAGEIDVSTMDRELSWYLNLARSDSLYSASTYPLRSAMLDGQDKEAWSKAWNTTWSTFHDMFLNHAPAMWKGRLEQTFWGSVDMEALPDGSVNMSATSGRIIDTREGIGWAPFPVSVDGQNNQTTPSAVTCAVISSGTQRPRAAWTWINFLASHPILPDWSIAAPAQPAAADATAYWTKIPEKYRESVRYSLEHGWYSNPYPETVLAVNHALLSAVAGEVELKYALAEASRKLETGIPPAPDTKAVFVAPPDPTAVPSETTINFYTPLFTAFEGKSKSLVDSFHKQHPEINVQFALTADQQSVSDLAGTFDCFAWLPEKELPASKLYDLNQFLLTENAGLREDFYPGAFEEFSQDGKVFGLPTAYRPNLIYYNADLLAQRGLSPPPLKWTYTDFIKFITSAASNDPAEQVFGFALEYPTSDMDMVLAGQDLRLVERSGETPVFYFNAMETREAVQWLAKQVKDGVILPVTPLPIGKYTDNTADARQWILDGRVAFWMSWFDASHDGSYNLQDAKFSIGVATIPLPDGNGSWQPYQPVLGQYISRKSQSPLACWEWIKFLSEQPDSSYGIPARRSARESQSWTAQVGPEAAIIYQAALDQRRNRVQENRYDLGPVRDWWDALLAEVAHGNDPIPLLSDLQRRTDAYTACLAASQDYQTGDAQQKTQAEMTCAEQGK